MYLPYVLLIMRGYIFGQKEANDHKINRDKRKDDDVVCPNIIRNRRMDVLRDCRRLSFRAKLVCSKLHGAKYWAALAFSVYIRWPLGCRSAYPRRSITRHPATPSHCWAQ
jgi:hypothetical protein